MTARRSAQVVLGLIVFSLTGAGTAASFDCTKAMTGVEKQVCASNELSALDDELAGTYRTATKRTAEPKRFRDEQRTWLAERDACLSETDAVGCLVKHYRDRIAALSGDCWRHEPWNTGMGSAKYITTGAEQPICKLMLENLNRFCHLEPDVFHRLPVKIDRRITTLQRIDWQLVAPTPKVLNWLAEAVRWDRYPYQKQSDDSGWEAMRDEAERRSESGRMKFYEATFDLTNDGEPELVRWAHYGGKLIAGPRKRSFGGGTGMAMTDPASDLPDRRYRFVGHVVVNNGTTYLLQPGTTEARLTRPFTSSRNGRLPFGEWSFGESTVCEFRRR